MQPEQNVLGLQMLSRDGEWLWVKHVHGGITINAGESLQHLTKGNERIFSSVF